MQSVSPLPPPTDLGLGGRSTAFRNALMLAGQRLAHNKTFVYIHAHTHTSAQVSTHREVMQHLGGAHAEMKLVAVSAGSSHLLGVFMMCQSVHCLSILLPLALVKLIISSSSALDLQLELAEAGWSWLLPSARGLPALLQSIVLKGVLARPQAACLVCSAHTAKCH